LNAVSGLSLFYVLAGTGQARSTRAEFFKEKAQ
jgi:hypothetical protein